MSVRRLWFLASVLIAVSACGSTTPPVAPSPAPPAGELPVAKMVVTYDGDGGNYGFLGATKVRFDLSGSTGNNLKYDIAFGDGETASGSPTFEHVYRDDRFRNNLRVTATVTDAAGRVSSASDFVHIAIFGNFLSSWSNELVNPRTGRLERRVLVFEETELGSGRFGGYYLHPDGTKTPITGTYAGDHSMRCTLVDGTIVFVGIRSTRDPNTLPLTITGGSADGMTLPFKYYSSYF